jgi:hypothetical protein
VSDTQPEPETCLNPGTNDDCNAEVDDIPGEGEDCFVDEVWDGSAFDPIYGTCRFGTWECQSCSSDNDCANCDNEAGCDCVDGTCADLVCVPSGEGVETGNFLCDELDNDCDSAIDEEVVRSGDVDNCGACGRECDDGPPAESCCQGECVLLDRDSVWPPNGTDDLRHCGGCGITCGQSDELRPACCDETLGDTADAVCTDLAVDEDHCGTCGNECGGGETCCDGQCVDTTSDEDHCGPFDVSACYGPCRAGVEHCCNGECVPLDAIDNCGDASTCSDCTVNVNEDCCDVGGGTLACQSLAVSGFCGGCGIVCQGDSTTTIDSSLPCCTASDDVSSCTDRDLDVENCGSCNNDCGDADDCGPSNDKPCDTCCPPDGDSNIGHCASLDFDFDDCGACGETCDDVTNATECCGGACLDTTRDFDNCNGCASACNEGSPDFHDACCPVRDPVSGALTDEGTCADLDTNPLHCGGCNIECLAGQQCCGGFCVDIDSLAHCGECGTSCTLASGQRCCHFGTLGGGCTEDDDCSGDQVCWEGSCALPDDFSCAVTSDGTCSTAIEP